MLLSRHQSWLIFQAKMISELFRGCRLLCFLLIGYIIQKIGNVNLLLPWRQYAKPKMIHLNIGKLCVFNVVDVEINYVRLVLYILACQEGRRRFQILLGNGIVAEDCSDEIVKTMQRLKFLKSFILYLD